MKSGKSLAAALAAASLCVCTPLAAAAQDKPAEAEATKPARPRDGVHMHRAVAASYTKGSIISSVDRERLKKQQLDIIAGGSKG